MSLNTVSSDESIDPVASTEGQTYGVADRPPGSASTSVKSTDLRSANLLLPWTYKSREWIKQVIGLLEAADRQLDLREAAHGILVQAASLLRKQIAPEVVETFDGSRGQLLAWQVRKVLTYIDAHIADRVLVADLSALAGCSEAHFSRVFKRTFGESPYAFVVMRRVELAARRMLDVDMPLSDVALSCGFADQPHLTRCFRHVMQSTPAAWKRAQNSAVRDLIARSTGDCAGVSGTKVKVQHNNLHVPSGIARSAAYDLAGCDASARSTAQLTP